jgi:hypothetical protein
MAGPALLVASYRYDARFVSAVKTDALERQAERVKLRGHALPPLNGGIGIPGVR